MTHKICALSKDQGLLGCRTGGLTTYTSAIGWQEVGFFVDRAQVGKNGS